MIQIFIKSNKNVHNQFCTFGINNGVAVATLYCLSQATANV